MLSNVDSFTLPIQSTKRKFVECDACHNLFPQKRWTVGKLVYFSLFSPCSSFFLCLQKVSHFLAYIFHGRCVLPIAPALTTVPDISFTSNMCFSKLLPHVFSTRACWMFASSRMLCVFPYYSRLRSMTDVRFSDTYLSQFLSTYFFLSFFSSTSLPPVGSLTSSLHRALPAPFLFFLSSWSSVLVDSTLCRFFAFTPPPAQECR